MKKWLIRIGVGIAGALVVLAVAVFALYYFTIPSEKSLRSAIATTDKIVVRSGGTCHRDGSREKVLFTIKDAKEIQGLVEHIQIVPRPGIARCMCCGNPTLEFYRGADRLAVVGTHHGRSLRWGLWHSDGTLTEPSAKYLVDLFEAHGLTKDDYR